MNELNFILCQINLHVGNLKKNADRVIDICKQYPNEGTVLLFPELTLSGYPLEDLVLNHGFVEECEQYVNYIINAIKEHKSLAIFGSPRVARSAVRRRVFNNLYAVSEGKILQTITKFELPSYGVFDETRTFEPSFNPQVLEYCGVKLGIMVCEDSWFDTVPRALAEDGAEIFVVANASPYEIDKHLRRTKNIERIVKNYSLPCVYTNTVGAQDDIVFDGRSFVMSKDGEILCQGVAFEEAIISTKVGQRHNVAQISGAQEIYQAIMLAIRDYVHKNGFSKVVLGVSGGIDSALVAALAVDALGSDNVVGIKLPTKFSSVESIDDADELAKNLGFVTHIINIEELRISTLEKLIPLFSAKPGEDITEENIQSRIRGLLIMAISNKFGYLVLTTGNKSEYATGYATIYGDMCGGFAPIKDIYKTQVYELAKWRNANIPQNSLLQRPKVIPENSITKPPSAELKFNQLDQDTLPPYDVLDSLLYQLIELDKSAHALYNAFNKDLVIKVARMLKNSEYKRKQSALGPKISICCFGKERRYPIINAYEND